MNARGAAIALGVGLTFGFLLSWGTLTDPDTIHRMLQLKEAYVFLLMASAVAVAFIVIRAFARTGRPTLLTREPLRLTTEGVERRHIAGSVVFGLGWAIADACPGPILAQIGQGMAYGLSTAAGVTGGLLIYRARRSPARTPRARTFPRGATSP